MKHRHFPRYNDDADFTTNAPSYYADLARKQKLIELLAKKIWEYEEILDVTLEEISNRLESYIDENDNLMTNRLEQWDLNLEKFPENVELLLQEWLSDGTLDHIINDTIFNWKADKDYVDDLNEKLTDKNPIYITDMGAVSGQDSTQALIDSINKAFLEDRSIIIPHGVFFLDVQKIDVNIPSGKSLIIRGFGQTSRLKRLPNVVTADWSYLFHIKTDGTGHANSFELSDLCIDDNATENPIPDGANDYVYEHSPTFLIGGVNPDSKILNVVVNNLTVTDPVADVFYFNTSNTGDAVFNNFNVPYRTRVRSDLEFSLNIGSLRLVNSKIKKFETESLASNATVMRCYIDNTIIEDSFDVISTRGLMDLKVSNSYLKFTTIRGTTGMFNNCTIYIPRRSDQDLRWNVSLEFNQCTFTHEEVAGIVQSIYISQSSGSTYTNTESKYTFKDCKFGIDSNLNTFTGISHVFSTSTDQTNNINNTLKIEGCVFDERFKKIVRTTSAGGKFYLKDNVYTVTEDIIEVYGSANLESIVVFDGGDFTKLTGNFMHIIGARELDLFKMVNVIQTVEQATYTVASSAYVPPNIVNNRIILTDVPPVNVAGFKGDTIRLINPIAGEPYEWVAINTEATSATWKVSKTLGA